MAGVATNRSNIALPMAVATEILQKTQEQSTIMKLARRVDLPGDGKVIPMITGDPVANWVSETGVKPVSNPSFDKKVMQAHKLAVIVPFSDEFERDRAALYRECVRRLPAALGEMFDKTVFFGPDAELANFDDFSQVTKTALDSVGKTAYDGIVGADIDISEQGGRVNGFVLSPQMRGILLLTQDANKRPIFIDSVHVGEPGVLLGSPSYASRAAYKAGSAAAGSDPAVPDIVGFAGDWTHAMWGTVEGVKIDISKDASLTYEDNGTTKTINLFQQNMFAVRAEVEFGFVAETQYFNALTRAHAVS